MMPLLNVPTTSLNTRLGALSMQERIQQTAANDDSKKVSILFYSGEQHEFAPHLHIRVETKSSARSVSFDEAQLYLSADWNNRYESWHKCFVAGRPTFLSLEELDRFNRAGFELSESLQDELGDEATVEKYRPIYSNVTVGDAVCGWWNLRDENYGFPISIQKMPVSDALKGDFMAWRTKKAKGWLDPERRRALNEEGSKLELRIRAELNERRSKYDECITFRKQNRMSTWAQYRRSRGPSTKLKRSESI